MTALNTHGKFAITNVSRRGLLKGVAATGGLVLAAQFPTVSEGACCLPDGCHVHAQRCREQPENLRVDCA